MPGGPCQAMRRFRHSAWRTLLRTRVRERRPLSVCRDGPASDPPPDKFGLHFFRRSDAFRELRKEIRVEYPLDGAIRNSGIIVNLPRTALAGSPPFDAVNVGLCPRLVHLHLLLFSLNFRMRTFSPTENSFRTARGISTTFRSPTNFRTFEVISMLR